MKTCRCLDRVCASVILHPSSSVNSITKWLRKVGHSPVPENPSLTMHRTINLHSVGSGWKQKVKSMTPWCWLEKLWIDSLPTYKKLTHQLICIRCVSNTIVNPMYQITRSSAGLMQGQTTAVGVPTRRNTFQEQHVRILAHVHYSINQTRILPTVEVVLNIRIYISRCLMWLARCQKKGTHKETRDNFHPWFHVVLSGRLRLYFSAAVLRCHQLCPYHNRTDCNLLLELCNNVYWKLDMKFELVIATVFALNISVDPLTIFENDPNSCLRQNLCLHSFINHGV